MTDTRKLAVELVVEEAGLKAAEARIKSEFEDHEVRDRRNALLSHARKFADRHLQEVEA